MDNEHVYAGGDAVNVGQGVGCPHGAPKDVDESGFGYCPKCRYFYLYPVKEAIR